MPRTARIIGNSGYYHIIARGIGKQILFEEDADCLYFLRTVKKYQKEEGYSVIAFCLMENHFHLLLKIDDRMDRVMKKLLTSYAFYFNSKYERLGHLFQDRYKSKPIENDAYLLCAVRYIHNNPAKAEICPAAKYRWSSWRYYTGVLHGLVETEPVLSLMGGKEGFLKFSMAESVEADKQGCFEYADTIRVTDRKAQEIIQNRLHLESGTQIQNMDKKKRDQALSILKEEGLSVRQIERLTGINRGVVLKA